MLSNLPPYLLKFLRNLVNLFVPNRLLNRNLVRFPRLKLVRLNFRLKFVKRLGLKLLKRRALVVRLLLPLRRKTLRVRLRRMILFFASSFSGESAV